MRQYPALEVHFLATANTDLDDLVGLLVADLDDLHPTAVHDDQQPIRVFFGSADARDAAAERLYGRAHLTVRAIDVSDEDWAARSQAGLTPVVVGNLTIAPPWTANAEMRRSAPGPVILIQPSTGFGTGHHASTRLCLRLLQQMPMERCAVIDVGTGSGVLAIAASMLGAARVVGIDVDPDALMNARENLALNGDAAQVDFREHDLSGPSGALAGFDLVFANLTGALLCRSAGTFRDFARPEGWLIASGFQSHELKDVGETLRDTGWRMVSHEEEQTWVGARFVLTD